MALPSKQEILEDLVSEIAEPAARRIISKIPSRTLRSVTRLEDVPGRQGAKRIVIDAYWAGFYLLGRGVVRPVDAQFLVYYKDIEEDPRGQPTRVEDVRRLDPEEFRRDLASGKLIVARVSGPWSGVPSFVSAEERGFFRETQPVVKRVAGIVRDLIRDRVRRVRRR